MIEILIAVLLLLAIFMMIFMMLLISAYIVNSLVKELTVYDDIADAIKAGRRLAVLRQLQWPYQIRL